MISIERFEEIPKDEYEATTLINKDIEKQRKKSRDTVKNRSFIVNLIRNHTKNDYDYVVCCSGPEGEGKSATVINLAIQVMGLKTRKRKLKFIRENIIYDPTGKDLVNKINSAKDGSVIIIDEAMGAIYKRNYNSAIQKTLNILFSKIRRKNLVIFFCIPDFFDTDKYFRQHRIKSWFYSAMRGLCVVFKKSNSPFSEDKWYQRANQRAIEMVEMDDLGNKLANKSEIVKILRRIKNYGIEFKTNDFDPDIKETYLQYKEWGGTKPPEDNPEDQLEKLPAFKKNASIELYKKMKKLGLKDREIIADISTIFKMADRTIYEYTKSTRIEFKKTQKMKRKEEQKSAVTEEKQELGLL